MLPLVPGFRFAGVASGIKSGGKPDLGLIACEGPRGEPARAAATFTTSLAAAPPVLVARDRAATGRCRAIVVNSGNANACTGARGMRDALAMARAAGDAVGASEDEVLLASTGVIGAPLPVDRIGAAMPALAGALDGAGAGEFARAILTTDASEKVAWRRGRVAGREVTVLGIAKGAGMIMPEMTPSGPPHATMLAFVCTDASVSLPALRKLTRGCVDESFNAITVDGDTSTNDAVFVLASGHAGGPAITGPKTGSVALRRLLSAVMIDLARAIVADGEGASHVVEIRVRNARSPADADRVARRIANSPLVKTAIHGRDPNWGRIVAAAASAGARVDPEALALTVGEVALYRRGRWLGPEAEAAAREVMHRDAYPITLDLRQGKAHRTVWTCDLSAEYVRINADYRS